MAQLKSTKVFGDLNVTGEVNASTKITVNGEEVWDTGNLLNIGTTAATARTALGLGAGATRWPTFAEVTGKPATYAPSGHTHPISQVTGLDAALADKADKTTQVIAGTGLTGGGTLAANRTLAVSYGTAAGTAAQGNDSRLSNSREWTAGTISQAEAEAGTATTRRAWTSQRVRQNVASYTQPYTSDEKTKLSGVAAGAQVNVATDLSSSGTGATRTITSSTGSNTSITYSADDVGAVPTARTITAGTGLSGGGTLAANRTLSVSYGTAAGTSAQGNDVRINNGQTAFGWGSHASEGYAKTKADVGLSGIPDTNASTANFLRGDGTWVTPPNTNTTYAEITTAEIDAGTASTLRTISGRRVKYALDKKSDTGHGHVIGDVTGLQAAIDSKADTSTQVIAGTGLSGGGTLAANRTLNVSYGTAAGTAAQGNDSRLSNSREWTAAVVTQAEAEAGTATTERKWTAQRVAQAISALGLKIGTTASTAKAGNWMPTWANVTGKPTTFTPSAHTHSLSQITDAGSVASLNTNASTANFLRGDGTWVTPPNTNTTYSEITTAEIDAGTASTSRTITGRRMKYALDKKADTTTQVIAGTGLTGGGTLAANRTLTVSYGTAAGTAAQGNDSRITGALQTSQVVQTTGTSTTNVMSQKATTDQLATKAASSHTHPWAQVTGQPATATRWPTFAEVTGKPTNYATTWASVASKPAQATRWPTLAEVTGKPTNYPTNWATVSDKPIVQTVGTSTTNIMSQKAVTDALGASGQPTMTSNATLNHVNNSIVATGITSNLGLEIGDVIEVDSDDLQSGYLKPLGQTVGYFYQFATKGNDVYVVDDKSRTIMKQSNGEGLFEKIEGIPAMRWFGICFIGNQMYASVYGNRIYSVDEATGATEIVSPTNRNWYDITTDGTHIYGCLGNTGIIWKVDPIAKTEVAIVPTSPYGNVRGLVYSPIDNSLYIGAGGAAHPIRKLVNMTGAWIDVSTEKRPWSSASYYKGKVYFSDHNGQVWKENDAGDDFELFSTIPLDSPSEQGGHIIFKDMLYKSQYNGDIYTTSIIKKDLFSVESIVNANKVIVNYAHAFGAGTKSLWSQTLSAVKFKRIAKWYNAPIGLGQSWVITKPVRSNNVAYLNNSGRPFQVSCTSASAPVMEISEDGISWIKQSNGSSGFSSTINIIVPNGWYFKYTNVGYGANAGIEYR